MGSEIVSFEMFEHQKENIQPLHEGHSAVALAKAFSAEAMCATRGISSPEREEFEKRIAVAEDLDDPLEVWLDFLRWTHESYPQGASAESGLVSLLERCATHFQNASHYANDPRYLRVWMEYIRYCDSPAEVFRFLMQRDIGLRLATFYEKYAHYLESIGRKHQADEVFRMGIDNEARPLDRLRRRYSEFIQRLEANPPGPNEPRSPVMPVVRPALATKELAVVEREANPQQQQSLQPRLTEPSRPRAKMSIFVDPDGTASGSADHSGGWESIGTIAERRKENSMDARPWDGETMRMNQVPSTATREKLTIFRDNGSEVPTQQSQFKVPALPQGQKAKREEKFVVKMHAIYPEGDDEELSFEELRAMARGLLRRKSANTIQQPPASIHPVVTSLAPSSTPLAARSALVDQRPLGSSGTSVVLSPLREKDPLFKPLTVQTMPLKDSPGNSRRRPASPTMTVHTRAATDEIYSMFNQPLKCDMDEVATQGIPDSSDEDDDTDEEEEEEEEEDEDDDDENDNDDNNDDSDDDEDANSDDDGRQSSHQDSAQENDSQDKIAEQQDISLNTSNATYPDHSKDMDRLSSATHTVPATPHQDRAPLMSKERYGIAMMTPIVETTESIATVTSSRASNIDRNLDDFDEKVESSPFVEHPAPRDDITANDIMQFSPISNDRYLNHANVRELWTRKPIIADLLVNPMDESIRNVILDNVDPSLHSFRGYYHHNQRRLGRSEALKRSIKNKKNNSSSEDPDIDLGGSVYRLRRELGEGAFAPVYLFERIEPDENILADRRSGLRAIKMEHPPSAWEFYIMKEIERRLSVDVILSEKLRMRALDSVIRARELHMFGDTSCLILDYNDQGTILDLVNLVKAESVKSSSTPALGLDECLVMFFTVELLRTIEALHETGILHGDLKPDNCMVRIIPGTESASMTTLSLSDSGSRLHSNSTISGPYRASGDNGWLTKGIQVIDFGRAIDMTVYDHKRDVQFIADWNTSAQDCAEMRELRPWTYQVDYHGLASIIHMMLFGKYIEIMTEPQSGHGRRKHYRLTQSFKRYWQQDIWKELFEVLLNSVAESLEGMPDGRHDNGAPVKAFPITNRLRRCREKMEVFLEENGERSSMSLRMSLQKLENLISVERRKAGI
ncbi:Mad3/BUB1 homology region 1-domain-containing protein [Lipomyces tetrasporus]|uniref:Mad3/BUB1 homology region 1-domain-containing protein n=1 Tax=Lipomyces tetrasporus TaxID=54092 RepID=A0AAD7QNA4_9ASCO|nr:Mad3/BUB1 homology region 1-domain-containing protein [Lipomyces tetrasporus]KAJ8098356.1 Mad3/BUB1 homology region 1-domain-containing protein [Lipomyces tetrasporus]